MTASFRLGLNRVLFLFVSPPPKETEVVIKETEVVFKQTEAAEVVFEQIEVVFKETIQTTRSSLQTRKSNLQSEVVFKNMGSKGGNILT